MKIQIALSASGLKNVGARRGPFKRVSSPFAVVLLHPPAGGPADILGKTETYVHDLCLINKEGLPLLLSGFVRNF